MRRTEFCRTYMSSRTHDHQHTPNRFAVIPTAARLNADPRYTGKGVTIAFLDSGFYPHSDLIRPTNRILAHKDVTGERVSLLRSDPSESWQWHGTQMDRCAAKRLVHQLRPCVPGCGSS